MKRYLQARNEVKSMEVLYKPFKAATTDISNNNNSNSNVNVTTTTATVNIITHDTLDTVSETLSKLTAASSHTDMSVPLEDTNSTDVLQSDAQPETMHILLGHEDGSVAMVDLTHTLQQIGITALAPSQYAYNQVSYDPRKLTSFRIIQNQFGEVERCSYTLRDVNNNTTYLQCELISVFQAHKSAINSMKLLGDNNDILTAGILCFCGFVCTFSIFFLIVKSQLIICECDVVIMSYNYIYLYFVWFDYSCCWPWCGYLRFVI